MVVVRVGRRRDGLVMMGWDGMEMVMDDRCSGFAMG